MKLTKHAHACVTLTKNGRSLVLDPGTFTPDAADVIAEAEAVLVTHGHFDHVDDKVLAARPDLPLFGPAALREEFGDRLTPVAPGDRFEVAGFTVAAVGGTHALIHADIPAIDNIGYVIDDSLYHPGDAYFAPGVPVGTLLLPTSGPWTSVGAAADFVRTVRPGRVVQIHEIMLSEIGQSSVGRLLGADGLTGIPVEQPAPGETIEI